MESNDLKSPTPPDDARFDTWLRSHAALPPLPDAGFSQRVLTALPAPQRRTGVSPRLLTIGLGAVAGLGFAAIKFGTGTSVDFNLPAPEAAAALTQLADPKLHVALGVTVISLAVVFWRDLRRRMGL